MMNRMNLLLLLRLKSGHIIDRRFDIPLKHKWAKLKEGQIVEYEVGLVFGDAVIEGNCYRKEMRSDNNPENWRVVSLRALSSNCPDIKL